MKDSILNYTQEELAKRFDKPFRAKQIFNAVYQKYVNSFEEITTLPKSLRASLNDSFIINSFETLKVQVSIDKSKKYLFKLQDGHTIETVL